MARKTIEDYVQEGRSTDYIAEKLGITERQARARVAGLTRSRRLALGEYSKGYIVIPLEDAQELSSPQLGNLLEILATINYEAEKNPEQEKKPGGNGGYKQNGENGLKPLPRSQWRDIVIGYIKIGASNKEILEDRRLKGITPRNIGAYRAHANPNRVGNYKERGLI
ncbi:hypothetical protein HYT56_05725 [Candidatus Woesearchaeota archaeon]|nr:hypothetical protein [Candidatus Woesearchaeota archaeon]